MELIRFEMEFDYEDGRSESGPAGNPKQSSQNENQRKLNIQNEDTANINQERKPTTNGKQSKYSIYPIFNGIDGDRKSTPNSKQSTIDAKQSKYSIYSMFDDIDGDRRTTVNAKQSTPNAKQSKYSIYPIFDGINGDRRSTANVKQSRFSVTPTDFNENEEDSKPILQASFYKSIKVDHIQNDDELEDETNKNVTIIQDFIDRNSLTPVIQDVIYNVEDDEFIINYKNFETDPLKFKIISLEELEPQQVQNIIDKG